MEPDCNGSTGIGGEDSACLAEYVGLGGHDHTDKSEKSTIHWAGQVEWEEKITAECRARPSEAIMVINHIWNVKKKFLFQPNPYLQLS